MKRKYIIIPLVALLILCGNIAIATALQYDKKSAAEVKTFVDVVEHLSKKKFRYRRVVYGDNRDKYELRKVMSRSDYYLTLARKIDSLNIVDFQCDTLCIYSSGSAWTVGVRYPEIIKCRKGFFLYKNNNLEPTTVRKDPYYNMIVKVDGKDVNIQPEPFPGTLQWFMLISNYFDGKEMIRLFPQIDDVRSALIRIVIHNNRVVYCDSWDD